MSQTLTAPASTVAIEVPAARKARRKVSLTAVMTFVILGAVVLAALVADLVPYSPTAVDLAHRLAPPLTQGHSLGTDALGRDILSRLLHGSRISLQVAGISVLLGGAIGILLGVMAGLRGGRSDELIMRATEITLGFPLIIVAILLAAMYGPSLINVIVILALFQWAHFARIVRAETLSLKERQFVIAARVSGASNGLIIWRHFLPHLLSSLLILASLQAAGAIQIEAGLSFFGAGVPPPAPSWGSMIADGRSYVITAWWIAIMPGLAIALLVLSLNLLGDYLRDTLDPRLRNSRR